MAPVERDEQFHMRLSQEERRMLDVVAERQGLSASDWVRQAIRQKYEGGPERKAYKTKVEPGARRKR
jgi:Mobilization protein NikA